jgi:glycosyltransferase involved in cell wall biosynthesis
VSRLLVDLRALQGSGIASASRGLLDYVLPGLLDLQNEVAIVVKPDWKGQIDSRLERFDSTAGMFGPQLQRDLAVISARYKPSLFWATHYPVAALVRAPLLVTVYDLFHLTESDDVSHRVYCRLMMALIRARRAHVLTASQFSAEQLVKCANLRRDRVKVLPIGIENSWFGHHPKWGEVEQPYFCTVGDVRPHKNLGSLLKAFALVAETSDACLVVVGDGDSIRSKDTSLRPLIVALGDRVRFTGFLPIHELQACVAGALALVTVSKFEGFGLTPLESMATGTPVIVSTAASLPEICGPAAIYVDPDDITGIAEACRSVTRMPRERNVLGQTLRRHAERYRWDTLSPEIVRFVHGLLVDTSDHGRYQSRPLARLISDKPKRLNDTPSE